MNRGLYQLSYAAICRSVETLRRNSFVIISKDFWFVKEKMQIFWEQFL